MSPEMFQILAKLLQNNTGPNSVYEQLNNTNGQGTLSREEQLMMAQQLGGYNKSSPLFNQLSSMLGVRSNPHKQPPEWSWAPFPNQILSEGK